MRRHLWGMVVVGVGLALSSGALAQPRGADVQVHGADAEKQGKAKFDAGREALRGGRVKEALALFQESWGLNKTAGTMLNIARCEEMLGLPASAWKHYKEALGLLAAKDDRVPAVKELAAALEPHVPVLRVRLDKGAPPGTKVLLGAKEVSASELDTDLRLDPGTYALAVSAPGFATKRYEVVLQDGKKETVVVAPAGPAPEVSSAVAVPSVEDRPAARSGVPVGLFVGGAALAGAAFVAGALFAGLSVSKAGEAEPIRNRLKPGECRGTGASSDCKALNSVVTEQNVLASASLWMFVGGGLVGAASALGYWQLAPKKGGGGIQQPLRVGAAVTTSGGKLMLEGSW